MLLRMQRAAPLPLLTVPRPTKPSRLLRTSAPLALTALLATGGVSARLLQICEENGVYFVAANNNLLNEEGYETFRKNPYYVGSVYADDKQISYDIVKDMIAKGASKIALFGLPPGISAAFDSRFAGAYEALAEANIQVLTEARSFVMPEAAQNLLTQYPDVEAIFSAVNASNYLFQPLMAGGYGGKVMLNLFDDDGDVATGFSQGIVSHAVEASTLRRSLPSSCSTMLSPSTR